MPRKSSPGVLDGTVSEEVGTARATMRATRDPGLSFGDPARGAPPRFAHRDIAEPVLPLPHRRRLFLLPFLLLAAACSGGSVGGPEVATGGRPAGVEAGDPQSATGGVNAATKLAAPYVVLVSLDGFASRYVERYEAPRLRALGARGVWAKDGMIPVFPSKTFPNHYSLATGMYPPKTGIVANTFFDPTRGATYDLGDPNTVEDGTWYGGEPLWVTAERQGMVAASYYWVGSEAAVDGVRPSYWRSYDAGVPNDLRVDQVLEWLAYPEEYRPHLVLLYMSTTDQVGHQFGPDSPEMASAVAALDATIGRLADGIEALAWADRIALVVLADHGFDAYPPSGVRYVGDVVDMSGITIPGSGAAANVFVSGGEARVDSVRDAIDAGLEGVRAYRADEVPERLHYRGNPRIGDLVLVPDSAHVVWPVRDRPTTGGFTHGWDNALLSMRALFVGAGRGLPVGREIPPFEAVQVYPLVTRLLGLTPAADIDGSPSFWDGVVQ